MCCCGTLMMPLEAETGRAPQNVSRERQSFTLTGRHVLVAMVAFFVIVASVNGLMMRLAISSMPGLDARNGYDVSQRYNAEIEAAAAQTERDWHVAAQVSKRAYGTLVSADISASNLTPLVGLTVHAALEHPATRQLDRGLTLKETTPGHYEGLAPGLPPGGWTLVLRADQPHIQQAAFISRNRIQVER